MRKYFTATFLLFCFMNLSADDNSSFINAAKTNDIKAVTGYIKNKIDVNCIDADGKTALMWAAEKNNIEIVKLLLENMADVNIISTSLYSVLHYSSQAGNTEVVKMLLAKDVSKILNSQTKIGWTPLICASAMGRIEVVKLLIAKGADKNIKAKNGTTAISFATMMGFNDIVKLLE